MNLLRLRDRVDHRVAFEQPIQPLLATLRFLASLPRAEAANEFLLFRDVRLLLVERALLRQLLNLALLHERGIIAGIAGQLMSREPHDTRCQSIQQISIVADQQHGAVEIEQVVFQPLDRSQIEVVRRLVEQEQIRRADE